MKHIKLFEELSNLSKDRKWPTYLHSEGVSDMYFTYDLKKSEIGKYLNTWFQGQVYLNGDLVYRDEMITLKKVDEETGNNLYRRYINPVSINILLSHRKVKSILDENKKLKLKGKKQIYDNKVQSMKAQIHSIDDSSYGIWWDNSTTDELKSIRLKLMDWINSQPIINGENFLNKCIELGADIESKDYN